MTVCYPSKNLDGSQGNILLHRQLQTDFLKKTPTHQKFQTTKKPKPTTLLGYFA